MRRRSGALPLDMSTIRDQLKDDREWISLGVVTLFPRESAHWEVVADELGGKELFVDVKLVPNGEPCFCKLGSAVGGPGWGVWAIPPVGAEVVVAFPEGEIATHPTIIRTTATRMVPDGLSPTTLVIVAPAGGHVLVHDGTANQAKALAYADEVQALVDYIRDDMVIITPSGNSTAGVLPADPPPSINGTTVLKGK